MSQRISLLYVPCRNRAEARAISHALLGEKLIACANILPATESSYVWKGKAVRAKETPLLLKTTAALAKKAMKRAAALHSYDCPCVIELPSSAVHAPFAAWVADAVRR
jgi:periplasmic divalent cation tolerance protein